MSHSSYTASERRGVLAIALTALLIIALGIGVSFCQRTDASNEKPPLVVEYPEVIDNSDSDYPPQSSDINHSRNKNQKNSNSKSRSKKTKSTDSKNKRSDQKNKKTYRQRSPLDEPV